MILKKFYKKHFYKVKFYDRILWKSYLAVFGFFSSFITIISFFATAQNLDSKTFVFFILIFCLLLIGIFIYMWWNANHLTSAHLVINDTQIEICTGDIFDAFNKNSTGKTDPLNIITANEYLDLIADNRIVSCKSLHGQYIEKLDKQDKLSALNDTIMTDEILNKKDNYEEVPNRKKGRTVRYSIGSVVEFESYVLTAFTKVDENNKASLTAEEYTNFWMKFWENIDEIYAGRSINIPLIGAGLTRFRNGKPSKQELLEIMLWTLKISGFHNTYSDGKITMVIYETDARYIDFYHIQHNSNFK